MLPTDLVDYALQYAARGWAVFPLRPRSKLPLIGKKAGGRGFHDAATDPAQIEAWWAKCPEANIGIATGASGLVVLDADGPEGLAELKALAGGTLPRTLVSKTGREGGLHFLYSGAGIKSTTDKAAHLDVRGSSGYIVAPPSVHPSGALYQWVDATIPIAPAPAWVAPWVTRRGGPTQPAAPMPPAAGQVTRVGRGLAAKSVANLTESPGFSEAEADRLFSALSMIDAATDYSTWIAYGAALHDLKWQINGTDEGFEIWDEWSSTSQGKDGRGAYPGREELERKWQSFDREYNGVRTTVASIYKAALERGWSYEAKPEYVNGNTALHVFPQNFTQATPSNPLIELNDKYAVIGDVGGKCLVMSWVASKVDEQVRVPSFQSFKSFAERYANRYVQIGTDDDGEAIMRQIGTHWLKWPHRKSFEAIDLIPGADELLPGNILNLWRGFAVQPAAGNWSLMRRHIVEVLAAGDQASAEYIARFAAWAVQQPAERAEVALVFRGGKGSGKGTFANAIRHIFGSHGLHIYNSKHLIGAFNGHLRACLLLFADEAFWAGDRAGESVLKGMLTERTLMIEQKGVDATPWRNRLHVIMAANAEWAIPASADERRYAVFDVSNERVGDQAYFRDLHKQMHDGGLAAMLNDLLRVDLGDWHPRQVPQTRALQHQKEMSLGAIAGWWENILQNGLLPHGETEKITGRAQASAGDLLEDLRTYAGAQREVNGTALGRFLAAVNCERIHTRIGNYWRFPTFLEARATWEAKMGRWNWGANMEKWRDPAP